MEAKRKMRDYDYFINNLADLYAEYGHRFLVIKEQSVIGAYADLKTAYRETIATEKLGTFIIQECVDDPQKLVQNFQFNVSPPRQASG